MTDLTAHQEDAVFLLCYGKRVKEIGQLFDVRKNGADAIFHRARKAWNCNTNAELAVLFTLEYYNTWLWTNLRNKWQLHIDQSKHVARVPLHATSLQSVRPRELMRK